MAKSFVRTCLQITIAAIGLLALTGFGWLTYARLQPLQDTEYCNTVELERSPSPWLPACKQVVLASEDSRLADAPLIVLTDVYEVGRFGAIALYIDVPQRGRLVIDTGSLMLQSSGELSLTPLVPQPRAIEPAIEDSLAPLSLAVKEIGLALGVSPDALACLRDVANGSAKHVEFRFPENQGSLCLAASEVSCGLPAYGNVLEHNRIAMESLKSLLAGSNAETHDVIIYGFATPDGTSQRNLTLSIERTRAVEHRLVEEFSSQPRNGTPVRIETTGRGESWPYQKLIPNLSLTPPSALVALCPATR